MSKLDDLVPNLSNMSEDDLLALVREIRADRRVSKQVVRTTTKKSREKKKDAFKSLISGLTPEQKQKLLEKLSG